MNWLPWWQPLLSPIFSPLPPQAHPALTTLLVFFTAVGHSVSSTHTHTKGVLPTQSLQAQNRIWQAHPPDILTFQPNTAPSKVNSPAILNQSSIVRLSESSNSRENGNACCVTSYSRDP